MKKHYLRNGFTLIELIVVLTCMFIIMTVVSVLICKAMDMSLKQKADSLGRYGRNRLLAAFRADVAEYGQPELIPMSEPDTDTNTDTKTNTNSPKTTVFLRWTLNNGTLEYRSSQAEWTTQIHRVLTRPNEPLIQERYILVEQAQVEVYEQESEAGTMMALSIWFPIARMSPVHREDLNPFTGEIADSLAAEIDPKYSLNWRTAIVCVPPVSSSEPKE